MIFKILKICYNQTRKKKWWLIVFEETFTMTLKEISFNVRPKSKYKN